MPRTRSQSKRPQPSGDDEATKVHGRSVDDGETLSNVSRDAVGKLLKRVKKGFNKEDVGYLRHDESAKMETKSEDIVEKPMGPEAANSGSHSEFYGGKETSYVSGLKVDEHDDNDPEWEDGSLPMLSTVTDNRENLVKGVSVEFDICPNLASRKPVKRTTAEQKEVAELVHKTNLLCLLGRGRLIDNACNDSLIQASLLSLLPSHLVKISEFSRLTSSQLSPLVSWLHSNFHVRSSVEAESSCHSAMLSALETREGTPEAVAALSVALFRALNLTTRFVSILDVAPLKPDADKSEGYLAFLSKRERGIFRSSTLMVSGSTCSSSSSIKSIPQVEHDPSQTSVSVSGQDIASNSSKSAIEPQNCVRNDDSVDRVLDNSGSKGLKSKGDLEFEMQMEMALSSTAIVGSKSSMETNALGLQNSSSSDLSPPVMTKKIKKHESQSTFSGVSTAVGSRKVGAPLYWAEVFCSGENLTGKWVHVDAVNAIIDGEDKVEAAAAACKKSLRYVVAFAGNGAKDVTRRYCTRWYKIASQRVISTWWDSVLAPLRDLESRATGGSSSMEDVELETRALTEPLPTNQQAYRNHRLYAIEKWLKKYEILHPKGPVLGFCSGHSVFPRTCVQTLHTKQRWLREGLQVKAQESPAKILKRSAKRDTEESEDENEAVDGQHEATTALYGKWQTEPLNLPRAVNGIVPKNERGQVDVWSEKCLPPGTVHLRFPRIFTVAKRLNVDYAPAMVGFDFRNGRSGPVYEGIVVCAEFKNAVLEAYAEEEERREAEERRRNESQALSRWYQLLCSINTRQRLNNCYANGESSQSQSFFVANPKSDLNDDDNNNRETKASEGEQQFEAPPEENHKHEFVLFKDQELGEYSSSWKKKCPCGFSIQFEEL